MFPSLPEHSSIAWCSFVVPERKCDFEKYFLLRENREGKGKWAGSRKNFLPTLHSLFLDTFVESIWHQHASNHLEAASGESWLHCGDSKVEHYKALSFLMTSHRMRQHSSIPTLDHLINILFHVRNTILICALSVVWFVGRYPKVWEIMK